MWPLENIKYWHMNLKYILPILFIALLFTACSSDDDENNTPPVINEVEG